MRGKKVITESVHIAAVATEAGPFSIGQEEAGQYLIGRYGDKLSPRSLSIIRNLLKHPSIRRRSFALEDPESFFDESPDERIGRFTRWATELSSRAAVKALDRAGVPLSDVAAMVVNTCTGYICPGISTYLIEALGLDRKTKVYDLVGSGCGGAIPNLEVAESLVKAGPEQVVLSVSVEVCSATFQMGDDLSLLVSNSLFGDGAAAAVLWQRPHGLELVSSSRRYVPEDRESIRYIHKDGQLYNQLSTRLPGLVKDAVAEVVKDLVDRRALKMEDVKHWALHTGGEKIVNTLQRGLGLSDAQTAATREILSQYGNMSSPTVWFVLERLWERGMESGDLCLMAAFGAGLSAHGYLLRKT